MKFMVSRFQENLRLITCPRPIPNLKCHHCQHLLSGSCPTVMISTEDSNTSIGYESLFPWIFTEIVAPNLAARTEIWVTTTLWAKTRVLTWSTKITVSTSALKMPFVKTMWLRKYSTLFNWTRSHLFWEVQITLESFHLNHSSTSGILKTQNTWQSFFITCWEMSPNTCLTFLGDRSTTFTATWAFLTTASCASSWLTATSARRRSMTTCSDGWSRTPSVSTLHPSGNRGGSWRSGMRPRKGRTDNIHCCNSCI